MNELRIELLVFAGRATRDRMPCRASPFARARSNRSECVMPLPAVIQFTSPGWMACFGPDAVPMHDLAIERDSVTVDRPMWGCGRTSMVRGMPGGKFTGPM